MLPDDFPIPPQVVTVAWQAVQGDLLLPVDYADWLGASLSILVAAVHHPEALAAQQPDIDARSVASEVLGELSELQLAARTAEKQQALDPESPAARPGVVMQPDGQHVRVSPGSELITLGLNLEVFARVVLDPQGDDANTARGAIAYSAAAWSKELGLATGALPSDERRPDATALGRDPTTAPEPSSVRPLL